MTTPNNADLAALESLETSLDVIANRALAAFAQNEPELAREIMDTFAAGGAAFQTIVTSWRVGSDHPARISVVAVFAGDRKPQPIAAMTIEQFALN